MFATDTVLDLLKAQKEMLARGDSTTAGQITDIIMGSLTQNGQAKAPTTKKAKQTKPDIAKPADPQSVLHVSAEAAEKLPKAVILALAKGTPQEKEVAKALSNRVVPTHEERQQAAAALVTGTGLDIPVDVILGQPTDIVRQTAKALGRKAPTLFAKRDRWQRFSQEDRAKVRQELLATG